VAVAHPAGALADRRREVGTSDLVVRDATAADAAACAALYAPYVADTTVSFEEDPPDAAEMSRRIAAAWQW
jgi:hypothetical protein